MNCLLSDKITKFSTNINILRFICAISVILSHSYVLTLNEYDLVSRYFNNQVSLGGIAVSIFFFLSGLYVTKSLKKSKSSIDFIKKRVKRIFPQLWIVVLFSIFVIGPIFSTLSLKEYFTNIETYKYLKNMILILTYSLPGVFKDRYDTTINGPLWTMPVEFLCYIMILVLSIVIKKISNNKNEEKFWKILFGIFTVISICIFTIILYVIKSIFLITAFRPVCFFLIGSMCFLYKDKIILNPIVALIMVFILPFLRENNLFNLFSLIFIPYIIISLILGVKQTKFNLKIFNISYEMYLLGWPIQQSVNVLFSGLNPTENTCLSLPIDILFGYLIYIMVEKILNRKNKSYVYNKK